MHRAWWSRNRSSLAIATEMFTCQNNHGVLLLTLTWHVVGPARSSPGPHGHATCAFFLYLLPSSFTGLRLNSHITIEQTLPHLQLGCVFPWLYVLWWMDIVLPASWQIWGLLLYNLTQSTHNLGYWMDNLPRGNKQTYKHTQQNSYSITHLLGTVTTQWLSLWRCSHCSLVPDTVTTEQWLHRTHTLLGIHYHGAYVEICLLGT